MAVVAKAHGTLNFQTGKCFVGGCSAMWPTLYQYGFGGHLQGHATDEQGRRPNRLSCLPAHAACAHIWHTAFEGTSHTLGQQDLGKLDVSKRTISQAVFAPPTSAENAKHSLEFGRRFDIGVPHKCLMATLWSPWFTYPTS